MDARLSTDERLLELIARREVQALELLYERHAQIMYNLIMRIVRDGALADELLHESFWQVWRKAEQYRGGGAPAAWLYRIARNKSLDALRRAKALNTDFEVLLDSMIAPGAVDVLAERASLRNQLRTALLSLPAEQRRCLELAYFDGMTQRQIAELSRTPVGTVKTRIRLGLEKLETLMHAAGYQAGDLVE